MSRSVPFIAVPMGVRRADTITASGIADSSSSRVRMLFSQFESVSCKKGNHMQIAGSSAIVVGGTGGLGEATVRRLHGAGAKVVVADVADDKGKALESELGVRYVHTDATSEESVQRRDRRGRSRSARCASRSTPTAARPAAAGWSARTARPLDLDGFKKTIEFYLTAVFNVMRLSAAAIAKQRAARGGRPRRRSSTPRRSRDTRARSASCPTPPPRAACSA